ncbi:hypothetical protein BEH94_07210 [Candidatus Altiarchaeales archaeon WOR_SM1_SCG]|nr:hypothetical protein BEH94_07210 [Candidatus Altiarchaeales archaeon WOR_SM1_SCG]
MQETETKTPNLNPCVMELDLSYANRLLGTRFNETEVKVLLEKMRYGVEFSGKNNNKNLIKVLVPAYRTDVLHQIDLVEDIAIAYGYENFKPEMLNSHTIGKKDKREKFSETIRELMLGSGFREVMTLTLTNERDLFLRMNIEPRDAVATENPVSQEHGIARTWLLPSLMSILENNKNREYPQELFEIGECVTSGGKNNKKLAGVVAHAKTNFSEIKAAVVGVLESAGVKYEIKNSVHESFIEGRCGEFGFGFFGEIHPKVLENFDLETPVCGFEVDMDELIEGVGKV